MGHKVRLAAERRQLEADSGRMSCVVGVAAGLTEDHVGKVVPLKFLEVDQAKNRLVVSNRRAMVETKLTNLEPGQLVQVPTSLHSFFTLFFFWFS